jgi:hypothetical protein
LAENFGKRFVADPYRGYGAAMHFPASGIGCESRTLEAVGATTVQRKWFFRQRRRDAGGSPRRIFRR